MTNHSRFFQWLDHTTPEGFFLGTGGLSFWVFHTVGKKVAVQLESGMDRPAFAYDELGDHPITPGIWLGPVSIDLGSEDGNTFKGRSGILIAVADRIYIKVNHPHGYSERLRILPFRLSDSVEWYRRFPSWLLNGPDSQGQVCVFDSRDITPLLRAYPPRPSHFDPYDLLSPVGLEQ